MDGNTIFVYLDNHDELPALYWLDPEYGITQISNYQDRTLFPLPLSGMYAHRHSTAADARTL